MTMKRLLIAASMLALAAGQAQAQDTESTVLVNGEVTAACVMGSPSAAEVNLGDMTGPDGKLLSALTGSSSAAPAATVQLPDSWCNAPNTLTIEGSALTLTAPPAYSSPVGFTRHITYSAEADGWSSLAIHRPAVDLNPTTVTATEALAEDVDLKIYDLETLDGAGSTESAGLILEAGSYAGLVQLTLAVD